MSDNVEPRKDSDGLTILTVASAYDFMISRVIKVNQMLTEELSVITPKQRFVLHGRVLNTLLSSFYGLTMGAITKELEKTESAAFDKESR